MTTSLCDLASFCDLQAKVRAAEAATTTGLLEDTTAALLGTAAGNVHMRAHQPEPVDGLPISASYRLEVGALPTKIARFDRIDE